MDRTTIDNLRELEAKATPGPWEVDYQPPGICGAKCYMCGIKAYLPSEGVYVDVVRQGQTNNRTWDRVIRDGDFIAAMRNALPGLLDRLELLTALTEGIPDYWKEIIGEKYSPAVLNHHVATHPKTVKRVLESVRGTEAADVIASLVHSSCIAWNNAGHNGQSAMEKAIEADELRTELATLRAAADELRAENEKLKAQLDEKIDAEYHRWKQPGAD